MENNLASCPDSPNCVSSLALDELHYIKPFACNVDQEMDMKHLYSILASMKGCSVVMYRQDYLRVECKSKLFGFIDDLEFQWDEKPDVINVRSASRAGHYDFGVNRRRVERIRGLFSL